MTKPIYKIEELLELGFQELAGDKLDDGEFYKWWVFYKNDSELHITYEYSKEGVFSKGYLEFNGGTLKGTPITKKDIERLILLM